MRKKSDLARNGLRSPKNTMQSGQKLCRVEEIPIAFACNYVYTGYRKPYSSVKNCLKSVFQLHNETANIWSHGIPLIYFLWYMYTELRTLPLDSFTLPYFMLIFGEIAITFISTTAHVFCILNQQANHVCYLSDYAAISQHCLIGGTVVRTYAWPLTLENSWSADWYVAIVCLAALYSTTFACHTRLMKINHPTLFQYVRLSSFIIPFIIVHVPLAHRILFCESGRNDCDTVTLDMFKLMLILFAFAAFLYGSCIPERFYPGKFDIFGQSHSLFHVMVVTAMMYQLRVVRVDMLNREKFIRNSWSLADHPYFVIPLVMNPIIVGAYSWYCYHHKIERTSSCLHMYNGVEKKRY